MQELRLQKSWRAFTEGGTGTKPRRKTESSVERQHNGHVAVSSAMTSDHKLGSWNHTNSLPCLDIGILKALSLGQNQGVIWPIFLLEALGKNLLPWPLKLLKATCISWLVVPSSIHKASRVTLFFLFWSLLLSSLPQTVPLVSLLYKETYEYIAPTWIVQGNLPISRSSSIQSHL